MLKEEIEKLPNHRLKEYLKVVRKNKYLTKHAYLTCPLGREVNLRYEAEFKEAYNLFKLVKAECNKRPNFK